MNRPSRATGASREHPTRILVVDDVASNLRTAASALVEAGYDVVTAASGFEAMETIRRSPVDILVLDILMPGMDGLEVLEQARAILPDCGAVMMTGYPSIDTVVRSMRLGAWNYIEKPIKLDLLCEAVSQLVERQAVQRRPLPATAGEIPGGIVGSSQALRNVFRVVDQVAPTDSSVLIMGETGTGKELVARAVHDRSRRHSGPYVAFSCAAIADTLLESELFGHEKGAFTDAVAMRRGRFELAHKGTLFLDEVGDIPLTTQVKLLRVLQERRFERVGGTHTVTVNVRLVSATNRNLDEAVANGRFRHDLLYRINVIPIVVPPLRERIDDIPALVDHFIRKHWARRGERAPSPSGAMVATLQRQPWPGNVRQLEGAVEYALAMLPAGVGELTPDLLPEPLRA